MSPQMSPHTIEQVHKLDNIQKRDFKNIIAQPSYLVSVPFKRTNFSAAHYRNSNADLL